MAEYVVTYVAANQRHLTAPALDAALAERQPVSQSTIAGIPYAEVYALDRAASIGPGDGTLHLSQIAVAPSLTTRGANVTVQLAWSLEALPGRLCPPTI